MQKTMTYIMGVGVFFLLMCNSTIAAEQNTQDLAKATKIH